MPLLPLLHLFQRVVFLRRTSDLNERKLWHPPTGRVTFAYLTPTRRGFARPGRLHAGGLTGHPAVLSREFGIPAVVGTQDATARIRTGDRIRVDGSSGTVEILEAATATGPPKSDLLPLAHD